jgi:hypothetical protein
VNILARSFDVFLIMPIAHTSAVTTGRPQLLPRAGAVSLLVERVGQAALTRENSRTDAARGSFMGNQGDGAAGGSR